MVVESALSGQRPGLLLDILQCTWLSPMPGTLWSKMSTLLLVPEAERELKREVENTELYEGPRGDLEEECRPAVKGVGFGVRPGLWIHL